ncbi:MAG: acyltransferase [Candidatus Cloacimonadaceae bacterium]|nr:acyltransferase [Candidatus Cloacimonadota bacterium]MDY0326119.1 acyltransferase [Candidatus Cloacimonadaceae bacterium]
MKARGKIEYRALPNHEELPFIDNLRKVANEHGNEGLLSGTWFFITVFKDYLCQLLARVLPFNGARVALHRWRGVRIGQHVHIGPEVQTDEVYPYYVKIGDRVSISGQNYILTHTKPMLYHKLVSKAYVAPVDIKDDVWIAIGVIILPGVVIGEGSIIASGSVVTKSIPPFVLAAGTPAVVKKDLSELLKHNYSDSEYKRIMSKRFDDYGF